MVINARNLLLLLYFLMRQAAYRGTPSRSIEASVTQSGNAMQTRLGQAECEMADQWASLEDVLTPTRILNRRSGIRFARQS